MSGEEWGAAVRLLWGPPTSPARGPKRGLTLEGIAGAAGRIADKQGLGGVSMQLVAGELGVTKMALYRYVPGKSELVALMVESAMPEPLLLDEALAGADGWRGGLEVWARGLLAGFREHPWLLEATVGARVMGPKEIGWMERALVALDGCGLSGAEAMDTVVLVAGHVRGIAEQERAARGGASDPGVTSGPDGTRGAYTESGAYAESGPDAASGPDAMLGRVLGEVMREHGERYPALCAALASVAEHGGQDQALEFGLERIFDGVGLLVERRTRG